MRSDWRRRRVEIGGEVHHFGGPEYPSASTGHLVERGRGEVEVPT